MDRMSKHICALGIAVMGLVSPAPAVTLSHTEDFTTTTYRDEANTTFIWDTATGSLRLPLFTPAVVHSTSTLGDARAVVSDGRQAFVANGTSGLRCLLRNQLDQPWSLAGAAPCPGVANDVAVVGNLAVVACGAGGVSTVDVTDVNLTTFLSYVHTAGSANGVVVDGHRAYVADGTAGLTLVDVRDPLSPVVVTTVPTDGDAQAVALSGRLLALADGDRFDLFDLSDPDNPVRVFYDFSDGFAHDVVLEGRTMYLADGTGGFQVYDVRDPAQPVRLAALDGIGTAVALDVAGPRAYVATLEQGLLILDIKDSAAPTPRADGPLPLQGLEGVSVNGRHAFTASGSNGVQTIDVALATRPTAVSLVPGPTAILNKATEIDGRLGVYIDLDLGIRFFDVSDPREPLLLSTLATSDSMIDVLLEGDLAYVAAVGHLFVYDLSVPANPVRIGNLPLNTGPFRRPAIARHGDLLYLASGPSVGVNVVSVRDPAAPTLVTTVPQGAYSLVGDGPLVYLADPYTGTTLLDLTDPLAPQIMASFGNPPTGVGRVGDRVYALAGEVTELDWRIPSGPTPWAVYGDVMEYQIYADYDRLYALDPATFWVKAIDLTVGLDELPGDLFMRSQFEFGMDFQGMLAAFSSTVSGPEIIEVRQDRYLQTEGVAQSLPVDGSESNIVKARRTVYANVAYNTELSADGGANWTPAPTGEWTYPVPGSDLVWRVAGFVDRPILYTTGTLHIGQVEVEWRYEHPTITRVVDFPNDQGRQVLLEWASSGYDDATAAEPVIEYSIYRREETGVPEPARASEAAQPALAGWIFLTTVPADAEDLYSVVVPTQADSTAEGGIFHSSFMVRGRTARLGLFHDSPPDSGYSVDNLAPSVPSNLMLTRGTLAWDEPADEDFRHFSVYGSNSAALDGSAALIGHTVSNNLDVLGQSYAFLHVTATDFAGNQSAAATLGGTSDAPAPARRFALHAPVPNPFNPRTTVRFELPATGRADLRVYDLNGRLIRTLAAGEMLEAGAHERVWDGTDGQGRRMSAGIYFCLLEAGEHRQSVRMVMVK